jgi:hypothetical protein
VLNPGSSYPTITVTAGVAPNAASGLLNQVAVSGGGFPSATATDTAVINAAQGPFVADPTHLILTGFPESLVPQTVILTSAQPLVFTAVATALSGPAGWLTVTPTTGTTPATLTVTASAAGLSPGTYAGAITIASANYANTFSISVTLVVPNATNITAYYFPHLAVGAGFQTTLTYVNYSPQPVTCQTTFYSDSGGSLQVPFAGGSVSTRTDSLGAGADIHVQTTAGANAALFAGWAQAQCTGPVKASLLYRVYNGSVPQGEAGVPATTSPATEFVTFAQTQTGVAYANPSSVPAAVTITALDSTGAVLGQTTLTLQPNAHGAANVGPLLGISSFTGSVQITSTAPIVSISLNAEVFPVFSSLPPGDLPDGTPLATGTITPATSASIKLR